MKQWVQIVVLCFGLVQGIYAEKVINSQTIKKEDATTVIDIKYPQGFSQPLVNKKVDSLVGAFQKDFIQIQKETKNLSSQVPGKNSLYLDYKIPYDKNGLLSLNFTISLYARGSAHPNNHLQTLNFVQGKPVELFDILQQPNQNLKKIADYCISQLNKKNISDKEWIKNGTLPTRENYQFWYFSEQGLNIVFDTYQVAAYVYGPQVVTIPKSVIAAYLQPHIKKLWWND